MKNIHLWGVKQNNLKDLQVEFPIGKFTVICGPSGSGKSSLAFETLYAEGQRRYIDSLSNYAKQFLNKAPKPDIGGIENIPPAIAIDQKNGVKNSRSTVGTTSEVHDYLRLLYEKIGKSYCPEHHLELEKDSPVSGAEKIIQHLDTERGYLLIPIAEENRLLANKKLYEYFKQEGYARIYVPGKEKKQSKKKVTRKKTTAKAIKEQKQKDESAIAFSQVSLGEVKNLEDLPRKTLPKSFFYLVIDRFVIKQAEKSRLADSIAQAYSASIKFNNDMLNGHAVVVTTTGKQIILDEQNSCSVCNYVFPEITAQLFSFNSPIGACPTCNGFGNILQIDPKKVIPDPTLSIAEGALKPFFMPSARSDRKELLDYCKSAKIDTHKAWMDLPKKQQIAIWDGNLQFYGVLGLFEYLEKKKYKMHVRVFLARHKCPSVCPDCKGSRLRTEASQVLVHQHGFTELTKLTLEDLSKYFIKLKFTETEQEACHEIIRQLNSRLHYLNAVGIGYLSLSRETKSLSGGEFQRLNLANQLGQGLSQSLYVLDEPTVGLHPRDNDRLIEIIKNLRDLGNTLVVVEHDHDVIKNSEHVIEVGPGSGHLGGDIIYSGKTEDFYDFKDSVTVPYLKPRMTPIIDNARPVDFKDYRYKLGLTGCKGHNLKNVSVDIPLNRIVTVTGVSGSGKSSLISQTLYPAIARELKIEFLPGLEYQSLTGLDYIKSALYIDQSPVGKTARSSPVTYLKIFDHIRNIMSSTNDAKSQGYTPGTFSLNVDGGRCPICKGLGVEVIDMMFMDDIEIICDACDGKKYRPEVLDIKYRNKNINNILKMTVTEAMDFFVSYPNIWRPLSVLKEVGLEYIQLGQRANTLSGGESQRLKLARELNLTKQRGTLFILDEPTTGLHFREVDMLLKVLNKLVEDGASVILIEHNLDIVRNSDYVIDIGPEPGAKGGKVLFQGPPEELMKCKKGHTGKYLNDYVNFLKGQHEGRF